MPECAGFCIGAIVFGCAAVFVLVAACVYLARRNTSSAAAPPTAPLDAAAATRAIRMPGSSDDDGAASRSLSGSAPTAAAPAALSASASGSAAAARTDADPLVSIVRTSSLVSLTSPSTSAIFIANARGGSHSGSQGSGSFDKTHSAAGPPMPAADAACHPSFVHDARVFEAMCRSERRTRDTVQRKYYCTSPLNSDDAQPPPTMAEQLARRRARLASSAAATTPRRDPSPMSSQASMSSSFDQAGSPRRIPTEHIQIDAADEQDERDRQEDDNDDDDNDGDGLSGLGQSWSYNPAAHTPRPCTVRTPKGDAVGVSFVADA